MIFLASDEGYDFSPLFQFDAATDATVEGSVTWSEYPVESGAVLFDFAALQPRRFTVAGIVTATPDSGLDEARPGELLAALLALVDARAQLWLSTPDVFVRVVLDSARATSSVDDGQFLRIEIQAHTAEQTAFEYVEIPLELLADEVKPGSSSPDGTADSTAEGDDDPPVRKSVAAKLADGDFGNLAEGMGF